MVGKVLQHWTAGFFVQRVIMMLEEFRYEGCKISTLHKSTPGFKTLLAVIICQSVSKKQRLR